MGFERWGHQFDGAYDDPASLAAKAGVYVVWCKSGDSWSILDVGESSDVQFRLQNHDRESCWKRNCSGAIKYSATYISGQDERLILEHKIRSSESVACGER